MKYIIAGTAGHIDHGKTALVKALTGIDADRLKEEKQRGITIDIGFADLAVGDLRFGFVDVPGHERFIKNMLAGAHGLDLVMLVIAADESLMPQTREHFDICRLLHIKSGLIVITKIDMVDNDMKELVRDEVRELVKDSFLEHAPMIFVSSKTGEGIDQLKKELESLGSTVAAKTIDAVPRLPIDRVFTIKGFGTVVTGTMIAGSVKAGDEVELLPSGRRVRVRNIQVHNATVEHARAGQRTAINLQGIDHDEVERGHTMVPAGRLRETSMLDARIELLKSANRPLKNRARVRLHHGTLEVLARVVLLGATEIKPGENALVQLRLEAPTVALPRDRFILRSYSPPQTIAGGIIIDALPAKHRISDQSAIGFLKKLEASDDIETIALLASAAGIRGIDHSDIAARTGLTDDAIQLVIDHLARNKRIVVVSQSPMLALAAEAFKEMKVQILDAVRGYHKREPLGLGIPREEVREKLFSKSRTEAFKFVINSLIAEKLISTEKDLLRLSSQSPSLSDQDKEAKTKIESSFRSAGLQPLSFAEVIASLKLENSRAQKILQLLSNEGKLLRVGDLIFHKDTLDKLKDQVRAEKAKRPVLDVATFKDMTGVSRKYAIPLLEYLDRERITRRVGNDRQIL
ncbi:MAG TPA: selenocysteine-specific translation elongation factor [Blastocatellia bacterium]|nr:selenocysteine-specific translation elongation factor [Blastocatellia bacterium]